jgi:hypothetical protein
MKINNFNQLIAELHQGRTADEATRALKEIVEAVQETGNKGELVLKIKIEHNQGLDVLEFNGAVSAKRPSATYPSYMLYTTPEGNLTRDDPKQMNMFESKNVTEFNKGEVK